MTTSAGRLAYASIVLFAVFAILPSFAAAATSQVSIKTAQLLPVGSQTCAAMSVSSVTAYVYDGSLHSFDVLTADTSYVAIGGAVGTTVLPFRYMTRSLASNGQLKIHTDNDSLVVGQGISVSLTLLSTKGGILCASTVSFFVLPDASYPTIPTVTPAAGVATVGSSAQGSSSTGSAAAPTPVASTTSTAPVTSAARGFCDGSGAFWLWLVLIIAYAALAVFAALSKRPVIRDNPAAPVAMILVPLILLVSLWYFLPACRAASWVPIALLIIAIAGLLGAFRENKGGPLMLISHTTMPIPMPAAKPQTPAAPAQKSVVSSVNPHAQKILEKLQQVQESLRRAK